jgi:hypothetical protein
MHTNYIQLPPDSTGKKLLVQRTLVITINDPSGIKRGDTVTTSITNNVLRASAVVTVGTVHILHAMFFNGPQETVNPIQIGEQLLVDGVPVALVVSPEPYYEYFNTTSVVSADNPYLGQLVDAVGQAYTRFAEGSPTMDAFGNLRVANSECIGYYDYVTGLQDDLYFTDISGTGSVTLADSYAVASVGSASGDAMWRSTTRYHFYQPGVGTQCIQTLAHGDTGKDNHIRRWGYGDTLNGMFWELDGPFQTTDDENFSVVIRSNVGGSVIEHRVPRKDWNGDKIDGTGRSQFSLNITGRAFYWIDFAWLGAGAVRFGILGKNGERITCHTFQHANGAPVPYTRTGSLPLFTEMVNTAATAGTSEMRLICSAVYAEAKTNYNFYTYADIESGLTTITTNTPLVSLRPKLTFAGHPNRTGVYPRTLSVFVAGGNIKLTIMESGTLTGSTWTHDGEGCTEGDSAATAITNGTPYLSYYLAPGAHNIDVTEVYQTNDEGYHVSGDGTEAQTMTLVATKLDGTTVSAQAQITYRELR